MLDRYQVQLSNLHKFLFFWQSYIVDLFILAYHDILFLSLTIVYSSF